MRILFMDDNEERIRGFLLRVPFEIEVIVVRDAKMAIMAIMHMRPNVLFLDHDLGGEAYVEENEQENCGTMVSKFLAEHGEDYPWVKRIICHSCNDPARKNMVATLRTAKKYKEEIKWDVWDADFSEWDWERLDASWKHME